MIELYVFRITLKGRKDGFLFGVHADRLSLAWLEVSASQSSEDLNEMEYLGTLPPVIRP